MDNFPEKPRVGLIAGPTASGKSALAMALAREVDGVIINADSAQVYADLCIVTARPSAEEEAAVPHRLFGYIDGAEACSAARWAADAKAAIAEAHAAGRIPILTGGTGLYIQTLLDGIAPIPEIDSEIRAEVRALAVEDAYAALKRADPEAAAGLRPTDRGRIARALEVARSTGRSIGAWRAERHGGIAEGIVLVPLILLPPRAWLYARCDARFDAMLEAGAVAEVEALLARHLSPDLPVMRAIGVPEIVALIRGELSREKAAEAAKQATRRYAKRQYTWFARQPPAGWPCLVATSNEKLINEFAIKLRQ